MIENLLSQETTNYDTSYFIALGVSIGALILTAITNICIVYFDNRKHKTDILTSNKQDWLLRLKNNFAEFISIAISNEDGEEKKRLLLLSKLKISADINYLVPKPNKEFTASKIFKNKIYLKGKLLEEYILDKIEIIIDCSQFINMDIKVKEAKEKSIHQLNIMFDLLYIFEWENAKQTFLNKRKSIAKIKSSIAEAEQQIFE